MDVSVNSVRLYALADSLGVNLEVDPKTGAVTGERQSQVYFGKVPVSFPLKVVSSQLNAKAYMLMLRCNGNLALLAVATPEKGWEKVAIHVLNLAKMGKAANWLEDSKSSSPDDALAKLSPAIVASFAKTSSHTWAPLL